MAAVGVGVRNIFQCRICCVQFDIQKIKICRTIIFPVILYGCGTSLLTAREKHRLMVFENWVERGIFGPKRDDVTEEWRILHNEELNDLYYSPNTLWVLKLRRMR
jgi:hypothetical protein